MQANKREKAFWKRLQPKLHGVGNRCRWSRIETKITNSIPDVTYIMLGDHVGWIELKSVGKENDDKKIIRCEHFTEGQKNFCEEGWQAGKAAWLMAEVGTEIMLFDGRWAYDHFGQVPLKYMRESAIYSCESIASFNTQAMQTRMMMHRQNS